jgi:hypothetical protein
MKKSIFLLIFMISALLFAEESSAVQILVPKQVFVGDTAEIQYVFRSDVDFFPEQQSGGTKKNSLNLVTDCSAFVSRADDCLVKSAVLERNGYEYTLILTIIPWKSGMLDFPPFDLRELTVRSLNRNSKLASPATRMSFPVDLDAVAINSLVEKTGATSFRPPSPPLVIPGTTWVIYGLIVLLICFVIFVFIFIRRIPVISAAWENFCTMIFYRRSSRASIKQLRLILKKECDDAAFCEAIQNIMRGYLERRFDSAFASETTRCLSARFTELMGSSLSPEQESAVQELTELFYRTDYVRYARGSADAMRQPASLYAAALVAGERGTLAASSVSIINSLEGKSSGGSYAGL